MNYNCLFQLCFFSPMPIMIILFLFRAICACVHTYSVSTCGFMRVHHGACHICWPTKKSMRCQQVQHNFEQYNKVKKNKNSVKKIKNPNNYLSLKFAKSTDIWAYMLIQIKVNVWVCTREVIYSLRNSSGLWLIKDFKIERSNTACNNCMSPARHKTPHHLTTKQRHRRFSSKIADLVSYFLRKISECSMKTYDVTWGVRNVVTVLWSVIQQEPKTKPLHDCLRNNPSFNPNIVI